MNKSFTLIEILVVIVVIGILSAFILVGMSSISNSANIAKGKAFSNSLRNSLLMNLVSEWKFDGPTTIDQTATADDLKDNWNTNNGSISSAPKVKGGNDCVSGKCIYFDGIDDYISAVDSPTLDITDNITLEVWVNNYNVDAGYTFLIRKETPGYDFTIYPGGGLVFMIFHYYDTAWRTSSCTAVSTLKSDKFYHLTATFQKNTFLKIYINGVLNVTCATSFNYGIGTNNNNLLFGYLGWWGSNNAYLNGIMDEIRIYNEAVSTTQIEQNYYIGTNRLFIHDLSDKMEYIKRIVDLKQSLVNNN